MKAGDALRARVQRRRDQLDGHRWFLFLRSGITLYTARRCFGMSAEAAFWAMFTLPFLILGLLAATAGVARFFGEDVTAQVRAAIIDTAARVLTPSAVQDFLEPLVDSVLAGSSGLTVLGFLAALWSGSRIFVTFAEGSVTIYGHAPRGYVRTRGLSLLAYVIALASVALVALSVLVFPQEWATAVGLAPGGGRVWVFVLVVAFLVAAATTMMFIVNPRRSTWLRQLPGGVLSVAIWLIGSWGLQLYFAWLFRSGSIYAAVASIIAVLVWALVTTTAMFIGMILNATLRLARLGVYLTPGVVAEADEAGVRAAEAAALAESRPIAGSAGNGDPVQFGSAAGQQGAAEPQQP
jgi:membrane protein